MTYQPVPMRSGRRCADYVNGLVLGGRKGLYVNDVLRDSLLCEAVANDQSD